MKKLTLVQSSVFLGRSKSYLHCMKLSNRERFDELERLGKGDLVKGVEEQDRQLIKMVNELIEFYYELEEENKVEDFSEELYIEGVFSTPSMFKNNTHNLLFIPFDDISFKIYKKIKEIYTVKIAYREKKGIR